MDRNLTYVKNSNSFSVGSSSSSWLNKNNRIKIGVFIIFKDFIFLSQRATWNGLCKAPAQSCFFVDVDVDFFFYQITLFRLQEISFPAVTFASLLST